MAKHLVHVLVPYTIKVACGMNGHVHNALYREHVTCKLCKRTDEYKRLKNIPRVYR